MCGITGMIDLRGAGRVEPPVLAAMTASLVHRGPDSSGQYLSPDAGLGARRLKIIDLESGDQPIYNEDRSLVLVCNGEIFNYPELRRSLIDRGHVFRTRTDVEVLVHLYEEHGEDLVDHLNGQFGFALWDVPRRRLFLARDPFGVIPLYYTVADGLFVFGSEVKAIFEHPAVERRLDLAGLDQVLSLPGLVSPRTMFAGISSLPAGYALTAGDGDLRLRRYWDLDYPQEGEESGPARPEGEWVEELREVFGRSVARRLQADVPVGIFVSGGLDSSLVAAFAARHTPGVPRHTFSIAFGDSEAEIDETPYQQLMARLLGSHHHEIRFDSEAIAGRLREMVLHCECPVKESYNTCTLALAGAARAAGVKVVLAGEGADELFGGYPGYRFDAAGERRRRGAPSVEEVLEEELRERMWGDRHLAYEGDQVPFREIKAGLYSREVARRLDDIDCMAYPLIDKSRLSNRHALHKRSYLDFKLRLADHLLSDHGDRMAMARSVEVRYPFLDVEMVDFARRVPPSLKLNGMVEKYLVKRMAEGVIPPAIVEREKFGFRAPGSPMLLRRGYGWLEDLLSPEAVRHYEVFDPESVSRLALQYCREGYEIHPHLDTDLVMVVLTTHLLCELFALRGIA
ncbi:MAG TPA: asparagine synthase (glutamine-hydrolyzing) [Thermoanaerobaculia bacterium]|jgi:asparagine synthase (glutamine-hydrolysing)|nr:asparagine synthase (glutamine-hydrolyzing) [Thermoanaerobaculia bacterium]